MAWKSGKSHLIPQRPQNSAHLYCTQQKAGMSKNTHLTIRGKLHKHAGFQAQRKEKENGAWGSS